MPDLTNSADDKVTIQTNRKIYQYINIQTLQMDTINNIWEHSITLKLCIGWRVHNKAIARAIARKLREVLALSSKTSIAELGTNLLVRL